MEKEVIGIVIREIRINNVKFRMSKVVMNVQRIDLGVFENNDSAKHCYEAVGFKEYDTHKCEMPIGVWDCIDVEVFL